jgi:alpha-ketoglutarate-dependent taurine dioxygenase
METLKPAVQLELPFVEHLSGMAADDFIRYYRQNKDAIEDQLLKNGAVKFKGVRIDSQDTFQYVVQSISDKFLPYIDGTSPRTKLSSMVYTSTEYDKTQRITMHNENSYSSKWPNKLFFSALEVADTGGETLLADSRELLAGIDPQIVAEVEARGVIYVRNLHGGDGVGLSWQQTFETDDKRALADYCNACGIAVEWGENDSARLKQASKGIIRHRITGEKVWFNQIDQFHPYQLGEEIYTALLDLYDTPDEFPKYVKFGDGTTISEDIIRHILEVSNRITVAPAWDQNELLIVDNELVSHGRNSYTGSRKVLVAMSE